MNAVWAAHRAIEKVRGRAREHSCVECGVAALDWAYQHGAGDEELTDPSGRKFSLNPQHYAPMCRSCHSRFDYENDPAEQARVAEIGKKGLAAANANPENQRRATAAATIVNRARLEDPTRRVELSAYGKRAGNMRRKCVDCGMVTGAGPLGSHQRHSGHTGYVDLPPLKQP